MYLVSIMPEIWLNYGITDVVLDIKAENLEQKIDSDGKIMDDSAISDKLNSLDLSKPMELVVLHNSKSILKIISSLFTLCEQKSKPFPKILTEKIDDLHKIAKALIAYETLTGEEIENIINKNVYPKDKVVEKPEENDDQSSALGAMGLKPKIVH